MADVFISYSSRDRQRIAPLLQLLEHWGVSVFWDQKILPGDDLRKRLVQHIESAKAILVVWSSHSIASDFVRHAAAFALTQRRIIQLLLDPSLKVPAPFHAFGVMEFLRAVAGSQTPLFSHALEQLGVRINSAATGATARCETTGDPLEKRNRGYAYWTYHESDRDYQKPTVLEIEERMVDSALALTVISPEWKRSEWTQRELAFAREIKKPLFHLRFRCPGPTLAIAGDTYFDFERGEVDAFGELGIELDKKGL